MKILLCAALVAGVASADAHLTVETIPNYTPAYLDDIEELCLRSGELHIHSDAELRAVGVPTEWVSFQVQRIGGNRIRITAEPFGPTVKGLRPDYRRLRISQGNAIALRRCGEADVLPADFGRGIGLREWLEKML